MNEVLRDDNQFFVVLVVDECSQDDSSYIWNKLKYRGSRIKMLSLSHEHDETSGTITFIEVPPLDIEQTSRIIQGYGIPKDRAGRFAEFCSGSPRVAHVMGQNLQANPDDLLKPPDTINLWDRYISGRDDPTSIQVQQRRVVLQHLALFK